MEQIFKDDDRVFHIQYGWGEVIDVTCFDVSVKFDTGDIRHISGDAGELLSFTEYTLEGFSQDRPEELPKKGDIVWVRDMVGIHWVIRHFVEKNDEGYYVTGANPMGIHLNGSHYKYLTTKNPYSNEHN